MIIDELRREQGEHGPRVAANVRWEDCDRPGYTLYFETEEPFGGALSCNPHPFLVGAAVPAFRFGEKRLRVEGAVCPDLKVGVETALAWLRSWGPDEARGLPTIEASLVDGRPAAGRHKQAGLFLSGGVDALTTLRVNHLHYPGRHPGYIRQGLFVFGLELDDLAAFAHARQRVARIAQLAGVDLVPVYTNVYLAYRSEDARQDFAFWAREFEGAALASVAHAMGGGLSRVSIAASSDMPHMVPEGSHPLVDPHYSSAELTVHHHGVELSRLAKIELLSRWPEVLPDIRVCNQFRRYRADMINCGRCEKCVRTMLALLALGMLERCPAFPAHDVQADLVRRAVRSDDAMVRSSYRELLAPLAARGRKDLVKAIRYALRQPRSGKGWRARFRTLAGGLRTTGPGPVQPYAASLLGASGRMLRR